jgi:hypothetical protein
VSAFGDEQVDRRSGCAVLFPNGTSIPGRLPLLDNAESSSLAEGAAWATMQQSGISGAG